MLADIGLLPRVVLALSLAVGVIPALAQRISGELRLQVTDSAGAPAQASCRLIGDAAGVEREFQTGADGRFTVRGLPFGRYTLNVARPGFAASRSLVEIRSEIPLEFAVKLGVAPVETTVVVQESETLLDPARTSAAQYLSPREMRERPAGTPGRSLIDLINTQPGWLLEANGVLHPRGSEYDVQYVVNGIPLYDNRSPAFAQSLEAGEFRSVNARTAGIPAEFGRKLGGVIEIETAQDARAGLHGSASLEGGSFGSRSAFASLQFASGKNTVGISGEGMMTDRYLDPPVEENFTNHASGSGFSARLDRDWNESDRTWLYLDRHATGFEVPDELLQQSAGQRQDRTAGETQGQISHTHIFSASALGQFRGMVRDTSARLWSNALSTPILPAQDRGFREAYAAASLSVHSGRHEWKTGVETWFSSIRENFSYRIVDYQIAGVQVFDPNVPPEFAFSDRRKGRDQSAFVQDLWRAGNLTLSAGLRFDHHRLVESESAWSPRLGVAWSVPSAKLVLRASYDRVFQVPAMENILLGSSDLSEALGGEGAFLPLRSSHGNYFEAGFSKAVFSHLRVDGSWYDRRMNDAADDSLLLNTGVSFPIAFSRAAIHGLEAKLSVPSWGRFSGYLSYSNMTGRGYLPVAGGLFLGDEAQDLISGSGSFPITQDQRNTLRAQFRVQPHPRVWLAVSGWYNSGLPFEVEGPADDTFVELQYGPRILGQVDFDRGRVLPSSAVDVSAGAEIVQNERWKLRVQAGVTNIADRLNVINFSGVFSGTALGAPRSYGVRLQTEF